MLISLQIPAPSFPPLENGGGFTITAWIKLFDATPGQVILDNRGWISGRGFVLGVTHHETLQFSISSQWDNSDLTTITTDDFCGANLFDGNAHHIGIVVDGGPKVIFNKAILRTLSR